MLSRAAVTAAVVTVAATSASPAYTSPGADCHTASSGERLPFPQRGGL